MVTGNCLVALKWVGLVASVTVTLMVAAPAAVGVPVMVPVPGSIPNPAGRPVAVQAYGVVPPVAVSGPLLYTEPTAPLGRDGVVIPSAGPNVTGNDLLALKWVGLNESVTVTIMVAAPATPLGSEVVVIVSGATMITGNDLVALKWVGLVASVTVTTMVAAPAAVGVPVMAPVPGSIPNPPGRPVAVQAYGVDPPVAVSGPL